jgi:hypothetical protein
VKVPADATRSGADRSAVVEESLKRRLPPVDSKGMGLMDRARQTAEQAREMAIRPADGEAIAADPLVEAGPHARVRSPFSILADKLDPGALADLVQKAGAAQEKVNATLRERGLSYRISEVCFTATFPPQVSFYIASAPAATPATEESADGAKPVEATGPTKAVGPAMAMTATRAAKAIKPASKR